MAVVGHGHFNGHVPSYKKTVVVWLWLEMSECVWFQVDVVVVTVCQMFK